MAKKNAKPPAPPNAPASDPVSPLGDCPWCPPGTVLYVITAGENHYVRCPKCNARGPQRGSDAMAIHDFLAHTTGGAQ